MYSCFPLMSYMASTLSFSKISPPDFYRLFQCPVSNQPHFCFLHQWPYQTTALFSLTGNRGIEWLMLVSMPYNGPTPFLLLRLQTQIRWKTVSMPYIGPTPFLQQVNGTVADALEKFQCPISGQLHFYLPIALGDSFKVLCFNALYRANSISTLGTGKPHKYWFLKAIFARNSQNILTNLSFTL